MWVQAVRSIAAGGQHTVAATDSSVFAWGSNSCGQLGTRTFRDKAAPTEVKDLSGKGVVQVACGHEHTLFLCGYAALAHQTTCLSLLSFMGSACAFSANLTLQGWDSLWLRECSAWPASISEICICRRLRTRFSPRKWGASQ